VRIFNNFECECAWLGARSSDPAFNIIVPDVQLSPSNHQLANLSTQRTL
jgi:hypothetical protein